MHQEAGLVVTIATGLVLAFLFGFLAALRGARLVAAHPGSARTDG